MSGIQLCRANNSAVPIFGSMPRFALEPAQVCFCFITYANNYDNNLKKIKVAHLLAHLSTKTCFTSLKHSSETQL